MNSNKNKKDRPRARAIKIIAEVVQDGLSLEIALERAAVDYPEHKAWLQEICSGTLRWRGRLELAVDSLALRKKPTGWVRRALLVAAYQLIAQDDIVPAQIVDETVDLITDQEGKASAGFANAVLRKLAEHGKDWRELPPSRKASIADKARWASLPEWMLKRFYKAHGEEWYEAYARASLERPSTWVRARGEWKVQAEADGLQLAAHEALQDSFRVTVPKGQIQKWPGFEQGDFFVQDITSQTLVSRVTEQARKKGLKTVLDLCSAPGGKAMGLAWNGFDVVATDVNDARLERVHENVKRLRTDNVKVASFGDATAAGNQYDVVWVDAPCTGSGILRRHPEIRWVKREADIQALNVQQRDAFTKGADLVRPGGLLCYSVCSVFKEEGADLIRSVSLPGFERVHEEDFFPQTAPHGDGFYFAIFQRA